MARLALRARLGWKPTVTRKPVGRLSSQGFSLRRARVRQHRACSIDSPLHAPQPIHSNLGGVIAVCHLLAGALAATAILPGRHPGNFLLNWAIPIILILCAIRQTLRIADADRDDEPAA